MTEQGELIAQKYLDHKGTLIEVVDCGHSYRVTKLRSTAYGGHNVVWCRIENSLYAALNIYDGEKSADDIEWDNDAQRAIERRAAANG